MSNEKCEKGWRVVISVVIMVALVASIFVHFVLSSWRTRRQYKNADYKQN